MGQDLSKHTVITAIIQEREKFVSLLKTVDLADYEGKRVIEGWSLKDLLGHITAWEEQMNAWAAMAWEGEKPTMPAPGAWNEYIQNFNQANYLAKCKLPLAVILQEFDQVYARFIEALQEMPEDDDHPYWRVWWDGKPSWGFAETYAHHYAEHGEQLAAWLKKEN